jgi:hypothetical protein
LFRESFARSGLAATLIGIVGSDVHPDDKIPMLMNVVVAVLGQQRGIRRKRLTTPNHHITRQGLQGASPVWHRLDHQVLLKTILSLCYSCSNCFGFGNF